MDKVSKLLKEMNKMDSSYSQYPFWFWNDELTEKGIIEDIKDFNDKGVKGFIIHPRMGLAKSIPYLSTRYFHFVKLAVETAAQLNMNVILYDEAMYPSGSAHGEVVKGNPTFASKGIGLFTDDELANLKYAPISTLKEFVQEDNSSAELIHYTLALVYSEGTIRGIYEGEDDFQPDAPRSADLINKAAVQSFITHTHERYYQELSAYFGNTIIGFFTDEPALMGRNHLPGLIPSTEVLLSQFFKDGHTIDELLTMVNRQVEPKISEYYHELLNNKLKVNYYGQLADWCRSHDIALMGHPHQATNYDLEGTFTYPGQDVVWRWVGPENGLNGAESTCAKCASDAARHQGKVRNSMEVYGACGKPDAPWDFTLSDMKWYLDWLFVRGVNLIIPHAFFYSIRDERRYERAPDVGPNNLWWPYYAWFANYTTRLSYLLSNVVNQAKVAIVTDGDNLPWQIAGDLYQNQIEFNYLSVNELQNTKLKHQHLCIQHQKYQTLIIDKRCIALLDKGELFEQYKKSGIKIIATSYDNEMGTANYQSIVKQLKLDNAGLTLMTKVPSLRYTQLEKDRVRYFIFVNEGDQKLVFNWQCEPNYSVIEYDPFLNESENLTSDDQGWLKTELEFRELKVFFLLDNSPAVLELKKAEPKLVALNESDYQITVQNNLKGLKPLESWQTVNSKFAGTVKYEINIRLSDYNPIIRYYIDLGDCADFACLDHENIRFWHPFIFEITDQINSRNSVVLIKVTNSLTNKYDTKSRKSGLLGPIKLYQSII